MTPLPRPTQDFAIAVLALVVVACSSPSPWRVAKELDTIPGYDAYLAEEPDGAFAGEATQRIADMLWTAALDGESREAVAVHVEAYLERFPHSEKKFAIEEVLADYDWAEASLSGSRSALSTFLETHPVSAHTPAALEALATIEEKRVARAKFAAQRAVEAEAQEAFARAQESSSCEGWEQFVERFHATSLGPEASRRVESLVDPEALATARERTRETRQGVESEGRRLMACPAAVVVESADEPVSLLFKRADRTYVSTEDRGAAPSDLAAQQALLRRSAPSEFYVLQVRRDALFGDADELWQDSVNAWSEAARMQEVSFEQTRLYTLGSPEHLWPDPDPQAPGGLGVVESTAQHSYLTMAYGPSELAAVLHLLPEDVRSWAHDRVVHAGWEPTTHVEHALRAVLEGDLAAARRLEAVAETVALEVWCDGHADARTYGEAVLRDLDPAHADERYAWHTADAGNTLDDYVRYLDDFGDGANANTARARRAAVLADDSPYLEAVESGNVHVLGRFVHAYPGHAREAEARAILEGTDLFQLIETERIQVELQGRGIERLLVKARPLVAAPVSVRVPLGTVFGAADSTVQNMVALKSSMTWLQPYVWQDLEVDVACTNLRLDVPSVDDTFLLQRHPASDDLSTLVAFLERESPEAEFKLVQAAIWILTDDADYEDLGKLRGSVPTRPWADSFRMIKEPVALRAMQTIHAAGLDVTSRRIWQDRQELREAVDDSDLTDWLSELQENGVK